MRLVGLSMTPSGIESATFRLVAQYLTELRNRVPLALRKENYFRMLQDISKYQEDGKKTA
jgi:hypothetical protein